MKIEFQNDDKISENQIYEPKKLKELSKKVAQKLEEKKESSNFVSKLKKLFK